MRRRTRTSARSSSFDGREAGGAPDLGTLRIHLAQAEDRGRERSFGPTNGPMTVRRARP